MAKVGEAPCARQRSGRAAAQRGPGIGLRFKTLKQGAIMGVEIIPTNRVMATLTAAQCQSHLGLIWVQVGSGPRCKV